MKKVLLIILIVLCVIIIVFSVLIASKLATIKQAVKDDKVVTSQGAQVAITIINESNNSLEGDAHESS